MVDPTLIISIDRTSLSLAPLALSGSEDGTPLGITDYTEPAMSPRISYAPDSRYLPGSVALSATWAQTILGFEVCTTSAASEGASRSLIAELTQAIGQFRYDVTVTVNGATGETWTCDMGTITPVGSRTLVNLRDHDPAWSVTLPAHPIRTP